MQQPYQMFKKGLVSDEKIVASNIYHCPTCDAKMQVKKFEATCVDHQRTYQICRHCWHLIDNFRVEDGRGGMCAVCFTLSVYMLDSKAGRVALAQGEGEKDG